MAEENSPDQPSALADPPTDVRISVAVAPPAHPRRLRGRLARGLLVLGASVAVAIAFSWVVTGADRRADRAGGGAAGATAARANRVAAAGVAAAYGYPFRCLSITISPGDRAYARAHVDRRPGCARYHGYVNASFHRVDGSWRLVLDEGQLFVPNAALGARPPLAAK